MAVGYCGASARIKFDDEQFAALFNELQARGDKTKPKAQPLDRSHHFVA